MRTNIIPSKCPLLLAVFLLVGCGGGDSADIDASASGDGAADSADADPNAADADPEAADADPDAPDAGDESITCGNTSCESGTECCVRNGDPACVEADTCEGDVIECQAPGDCPGEEICCHGDGANTECTTAGQCAAFVCEDDVDCPGNQVCCPGETSSTCALSCDDET